ncbi:MAG: exopolysaccharide biosynthesis protein [Magnetococcales bacterium]|nr:exopolysaccharide biosynthesis protein [Magnetococcales bacterium]
MTDEDHVPADDELEPEPPSRILASRLLHEFAERWGQERVRLRDIVDVLGDRAYGLLLLVFAAPNIIPSPVPGLSGILGVPLVLAAYQLAHGRRHPWFPSWLAERSIASADFRTAVGKVVPWLGRVERFLRPRYRAICRPPAERFLGAFCLILAVVMALPIPLGNMLPALAVSLIALGLIEHDGLAITTGIVLGLVSLAIVAGVVLAMLEAFIFFLRQAF